MRGEHVFLDTNVLVYAFDAGEPKKRARAQEVLAALEGAVVSTQILAETYTALTRGLKPKLSAKDAEVAVNALSDLTVQLVDVPAITAAMVRARREMASFWDALVIETALAAKCTRLLTEDLQHGQRFGALVIENPFLG